MRHLLFLILILSSHFAGFTQRSSDYQLLWRIDGNGLEHPSFLFGTMHVRDSRAFEFSDSVFLAMESCDAFALEIHPDSFSTGIGSALSGQAKISLRDLVDDETYQELDLKMQEIKGFGLENLNNQSPAMIKTLLRPSFNREDDKHTFVDAYLYGVAKSLEKSTHGLEDISSQFQAYSALSDQDRIDEIRSYLEVDSTKFHEYMNHFIESYNRGNLREIMRIYGRHNLEDSVMKHRNQMMLASLTGIMDSASVFAAVGVAHLPGKEGLIELLRMKGYQVSQVSATFTGVKDRFTYNFDEEEWVEYVDSTSGLTVNMPGIPSSMHVNDQIPMAMFLDLPSGCMYAVSSMRLPYKASANAEDSLLQNMKIGYFSNLPDLNGEIRDILVEGKKGLEVPFRKYGYNYITHAFFSGGFLHQVIFAAEGSATDHPLGLRFFSSVSFNDSINTTAPDWVILRDVEGAFSAQFPAGYQSMEQSTPIEIEGEKESVDIKMYYGVSQKTGSTYLLAYNDLPPGSRILSESLSLLSTVQEISGRGELVGKVDTITVEGYPGRNLTIDTGSEGLATISIFLRGNRYYKIIQIGKPQNRDPEEEKEFWDSFHFLPFQPSEFVVFHAPDSTFQLPLFHDHRWKKNLNNQSEGLYTETHLAESVDPFSGTSLTLEVSEFSPYTRIQDNEEFIQMLHDEFLGWNDSSLHREPFTIDNHVGETITIVSQRSGRISKYASIIIGTRIYVMGFYGTNERMESGQFEEVLSSWKARESQSDFDLGSSKSTDILQALQSNDSSQIMLASSAISLYQFEEEEFPDLYQALSIPLPDDSSTYNSTKLQIIDILESEGDLKAIPVLESLYQQPETNDIIRCQILRSLVKIDSAQGLEIYKRLLTTSPPDNIYSAYSWLRPVIDSIDLAEEMLPVLFQFLHKEDNRKEILGILYTISQSAEGKEMLSGHSDQIYRYLGEDFQTIKQQILIDSIPDYSTSLPRYLTLLNHIPQAPYTDSLSAFGINHSTYYQSTSLLIRIRNLLAVEDSILQDALQNWYSKREIIQALIETEQEHRVPPVFLTMEGMGQLVVESYLADSDESEPDSIRFLGTIEHGDSILAAYFVEYVYDESGYSYLGLAGPFSKDGSFPQPDQLKGLIDWEGHDDPRDWQEAAEALKETFEDEAY